MYSKSAELRALFTDTLNKVSQMAHNLSRSHQQVKPQYTGEIVSTTAKYWVSTLIAVLVRHRALVCMCSISNNNTLLLLQSLSFKEKVTSLKFKEKTSEDGPSAKYLLFWIVRLIHADPILMLNVSTLSCSY